MSYPNDQDDSFDAERTQPRDLEWRPPESRPSQSPQDTQVTQQAKPAWQGSYDRRYRRPPTEGAPTWLVLIFVGLLMAIIVVLGAAFVLSRSSREPKATPTAVVITPVPPATATQSLDLPTPQTSPQPDATSSTPEQTTAPTTSASAPTSMTVGGYAKVVAPAGLSFRDQSSPSGVLIEVLETGSVLSIVEGPQESEGYTWWKLRKADGQEGWSADGSGEDVFLEPAAAP